ncbi:crossover junction endodeoxyribonuclease RuvC [Candidatus Woesebacteria bacterium]|nr:crossover junction endodeoxyribonuclease RuvC [Candidatus Woesebacteria bacterium]
MKILGIDPGTATSGYGVIYKNTKSFEVLDWGLIETDKAGTKEKRLEFIFQSMLELFEKHSPDILAIEKIFFAANAKTAIAVGQAQGVMLLAAAKSNVFVVEYAPGSIKKMVAGNGRADKKMMQKALRKVFGAKVRSAKHKKTHFDNAADALAVALTHAMKV